MKKKYYKVVRVIDNKFYSCMAEFLPKKYVLEYKLGVETIPNIGYIYTFGTKDRAVDFLKQGGEFESKHCILFGYGKESKAFPVRMSAALSLKELATFWKNNYCAVSACVEGSIWLESFTPEKIIWI